ncbi:MAG: NUDIX domain-containing protein [Candidatus Peribacteraceae bacterium]|nr:NUDIX domain-containing protein [Candidatus Peribacteraceae bacterium]
MKEYCLGFAFPRIELANEEVVLIRKNRPAFQNGKLNGVGGKVEKGESGIAAMCREFKEETGVSTEESDWRHVCTFIFENNHIHVLTTSHCRFGACRTTTDEEVVIRPISSLCYEEKMENLGWLVPMCLVALQHPGSFFPFLVEHYPE